MPFPRLHLFGMVFRRLLGALGDLGRRGKRELGFVGI
jgi:hypothetical protein